MAKKGSTLETLLNGSLADLLRTHGLEAEAEQVIRDRGGRNHQVDVLAARGVENWLVTAGARIHAHPDFGRADLVATKPGVATVVVEVEGDSSRQQEQALYSEQTPVRCCSTGAAET